MQQCEVTSPPLLSPASWGRSRLSGLRSQPLSLHLAWDGASTQGGPRTEVAGSQKRGPVRRRAVLPHPRSVLWFVKTVLPFSEKHASGLGACLSSALLSLTHPVGQKSLEMHLDVEAAEGRAEGCHGRPWDTDDQGVATDA